MVLRAERRDSYERPMATTARNRVGGTMAVCVADSYPGKSLDEEADVGVSVGVLVLLEAKPGKGDDLAKFLEEGRALAVAEPETGTPSGSATRPMAASMRSSTSPLGRPT
jgi:hypothetical protein